VAVVALLLCATFAVISFSLRPQPDATGVLLKADRLVRTAGDSQRAHERSPATPREPTVTLQPSSGARVIDPSSVCG